MTTTQSRSSQHKVSRKGKGGNIIGTWGLPILAVLIFALFAILLPGTFPTGTNLKAILTNQAIPAILAIGATIPIVTGRFDLSIGYGIGLWLVTTMYLLVNTSIPWPIAGLIVLAGGLLVGLINGLLVELAHIDSFIATLGTGSILYAITGWITGGGRIVPGAGGLPVDFTDMTNSTIFGLPITFYYLLIIVILLWLCLEHLPIGRYLYVVGANPRAADLVGINRRRIVVYAFLGSGVITAIAGFFLASQQQIGDPSAGAAYLLPAFVGALLGSTTIKPGRANAFGTLIAVAILAIGLSGLQQLGAQFWVTPLFNGLTLLAAVGLAGFAARRRQKAGVIIGGATGSGGGGGKPEPSSPPPATAPTQRSEPVSS